MTNKEHIDTLRALRDGRFVGAIPAETINAAIAALEEQDTLLTLPADTTAKSTGADALQQRIRTNLNTFATTKEAAEYVLSERSLARAEVEAKYATLVETTTALNEALTEQRAGGSRVSLRVALAQASVQTTLDELGK